MASSVLPIVLAGTGIALVAKAGSVAAVPRRGEYLNDPDAPPPKPTSALAGLKERYSTAFVGNMGSSPMVVANPMEVHTTSPREVTDRILRELKADFEAATGEAKKKICEDLKKEFPGEVSIQQIDCSKPAGVLFQSIVIAVGTAAGAAAGAWIAGPIGAKLGAVIGGAVGKVGYDYVSGAWRDSWAEDAYEESKAWVEGVYEDVGEIAGDVADKIGSWIGI